MAFQPPKKKWGKALWATAFPEQHKKLRPEQTKAGGVRYRSVSEDMRMAIYVPIAKMFKEHNPWCQCCAIIRGIDPNDARVTEDIHHTRGREGLLLFDIRYWLAACRICHNWIKDHPKEAIELGLDQSHKN